MKQYIAAVLTALLCMPVVLAAQENTAEAKQQESAGAKEPKKDSADGAAKESEEVEVMKTPFGTITRPISRKPPEPKGPPSVRLFEIEEKGTAVTFKKKTPFGVTSWTKQQADLTDEERQLLAEYRASKESGGTAAKPGAAEPAKRSAAGPAKVKAETTENKKP
jgi:hypothetical protein